jgi:hypothetical protein
MRGIPSGNRLGSELGEVIPKTRVLQLKQMLDARIFEDGPEIPYEARLRIQAKEVA